MGAQRIAALNSAWHLVQPAQQNMTAHGMGHGDNRQALLQRQRFDDLANQRVQIPS